MPESIIKKIVRISIPLSLVFVSSLMVLFFLPVGPLFTGLGASSQAIYDEGHHLLRLTLSEDEQYRLFVPLSKVPKTLIEVTLLQEDQYFYWHFGINPFAMVRAFSQTYIKKSRRLGASTITMQVARMRLGFSTKKPLGKILQVIEAVRLEMHYSKSQILEAYFNLAPYGNNIQGIAAASLIYFNKPVEQLTLPEIMTLVIMPQNPIHRLPQQKKFHEARQQLFTRWIKKHPQDLNKKKLMDLPLQLQTMHDLPFIAPHFVNEVLSETRLPIVTTTLDLGLQKTIETITRNYIASKQNIGVDNAAVLLVDTRDNSIKALMGSVNFFNSNIQGQIDGTLADRSPGSTLKPFIYGLAIDQGLIHPATVLKDVPHSFGSYDPENFDYDFMGPIKAQDALLLSRNIPAITLAEQLNPSLYDFLQAAEITHLKSENYYGLSLVLGGAEISMQELASLYAMLLNEGIWRPLRKYPFASLNESKRLLSPEASFLVLDMLQQFPRRDLPAVSIKTGTSSGFRDAWSAGTLGPYVLVVWIGHFDNQSNPAFVGKTIAVPLLLALMEALNKQMVPLLKLDKNIKNLNIKKIAVCKASGLLPTRDCPDTEMAWFIPGKSPIQTDTIFRAIPINQKTGLRACHFNQQVRFEVYEFWPSDLLKIFRQAGIQRRSPPLFEEGCGEHLVDMNGLSPQVTSPHTGISYIVPAHLKKPMTIPLTATADADVHQLFWFINENFLGKVLRDRPLLWASRPGRFVVRVVDDHGRSDVRDLIVQEGP